MIIELQDFLFLNNPGRTDLIKYKSVSKNKYKIFVFRNHSFELIESIITPYLDYADMSVEFEYSGYDDSFSFQELNDNSDMIIIWIDTYRYNISDISVFMKERVEYLKKIYKKSILLVPFGTSMNAEILEVPVLNLDSIKDFLKENFTDEKRKSLTGTLLSNNAMLEISKILGLKYIPYMLKTNLKAIVVDLDNTLYKGVLAEDGVNSLILDEGHINLQRTLKKLKNEGFFLCIASKNNILDVDKLFEIRKDFLLEKSDFTKICASWDKKSKSIEIISKYINISIDSMLFIDDNIGEIFSVSMEYPMINVIRAYENAELTNEVLNNYPGLMKFNFNIEDSLRMKDVKANEERKNMLKLMSESDYIKSLNLKLTFDYNNISQKNRIQELSVKTNQFIFNYMRYSLSQIEELLENENSLIISISLSDRLSDSGLIAVCVGKNKEDFIEIEELFVSCRALGRGIDNIIVLGAISKISEFFNKDKIKVRFEKGDRNEPAEIFINKYLINYIDKEEKFSYTIDKDLVEIIDKNNI